jgi:pyruvate,water dikinase
LVDEDRSGVAFGRDPRQPTLEQAIVECVPGPCGDLVDGVVDPDRWVLHRTSGQVLSWRPGEREGEEGGGPLLGVHDLSHLLNTLLQVESTFGWPADTEWTGREERFTLLQARPITTAGEEAADPRSWYLTLRPGMRRLSDLAARVAGKLIPELQALGEQFAEEAIEGYDDEALASAIDQRRQALDRWRQIYLDDFIPLAHGVRQLGIYYNDAVRPPDPYEFVGLLKGEHMVASQRNEALVSLADRVRGNAALADALKQAAALMSHPGGGGWQRVLEAELGSKDAQEAVAEIETLLEGFLDVAYGNERLSDRPDLVFNTILEMASAEDRRGAKGALATGPATSAAAQEQRLLDAVGPARQEEAREMLAIGRLSWRLRDDDNLLVGRLESQLLRALNVAASRLRTEGRLAEGARVSIPAAPALTAALRDRSSGMIKLPEPEPEQPASQLGVGESPRQLVGQPAAPGLASGRVRVIRSTEDLGQFQAGEVLVCDAIQPTMTHLVPLACAIVERRGGMLIHGAIIARELGIPCANGIANATDLLRTGDVVTVDGYLGIVTVGPPEFELEGV